VPEQIAGLRTRVHHQRDKDATQLLGGGTRQLALPAPRLAMHQERPLSRQGGIDGVDGVSIEEMHLTGPAATPWEDDLMA
jgi:hypothetical protein